MFLRGFRIFLAVLFSGCVVCVPAPLAAAQPNAESIIPWGADYSLICEAGPNLSGGAAGGATEQEQQSLSQFRQLLIQRVSTVDINRDGKLDRHEFEALPRVLRQQAIEELDANGDQQLSQAELTPAEPNQANPEELGASPEPAPSLPKEPETFRNVRRFGIGLPVATPQPKPNPFAQAARFGTSPNFTRPPRKSNFNSRRDGLDWTTVSGRVDTIFISSGCR